MLHRHINDTGYSLTAIDDIIERGRRKDWAELQIAVRDDPDLCGKVFEYARKNLEHPYTIRFHFWYHYTGKLLKCQTQMKENPNPGEELPNPGA